MTIGYHRYTLPRESMTDREREIVALVRRGITDLEIAAQLGISFKTVRAHLANIYKKLNIQSRKEL